jgi:hypothetical protein
MYFLTEIVGCVKRTTISVRLRSLFNFTQGTHCLFSPKWFVQTHRPLAHLTARYCEKCGLIEIRFLQFSCPVVWNSRAAPKQETLKHTAQ